MFKSVLTVVGGSNRFGGGVCQNLQTIVVDTILNGFNFVLDEKKTVSKEAESKCISVKWRWYDLLTNLSIYLRNFQMYGISFVISSLNILVQ